MEKKIVFFDIDGTLTGNKENKNIMPESTKTALKKLKENRHLVVVCSGRPIKYILEKFGHIFDGYICANGTYIVYEDKCIYNRLIDKGMLEKLMSVFEEIGAGCNFIGDYNGYAYNMDKDIIDDVNSWFHEGTYVLEKWEIENVKANILDIFYKDDAQLKKCVHHFSDNLIFNDHTPHMSADVSFKDWNKSDGVKYFVNHIGMSMESTYAFGDGYNDIDMLKTVNTGIAMGNGVEELKIHADFITSSIFEDGIYKALRKYELI